MVVLNSCGEGGQDYSLDAFGYGVGGRDDGRRNGKVV